MEPKHGGLVQDDFPFQLGVFSGSMLILKGVLHVFDTYHYQLELSAYVSLSTLSRDIRMYWRCGSSH